jgi:hypothetical protein
MKTRTLLSTTLTLALLCAAPTALAQSAAGSTRAPGTAGTPAAHPRAASTGPSRAPAPARTPAPAHTPAPAPHATGAQPASTSAGATPSPPGSTAAPGQGEATVTRTPGNNANYDFRAENVQGTNVRSEGASTQVRPPAPRPGLIRTRDNFRNETLRGAENQPAP